MKKSNKKKLALVLLNYNNYEFLDRCLLSIPENLFDKIIFVDDTSIDESQHKYISKLDEFRHLNINVFFNKSNLGVKQSLLNVVKNSDDIDYYQLLATDDAFEYCLHSVFSELMDTRIVLMSGYYVDENDIRIGKLNNSTLLSNTTSAVKSLIYYANPVKAPGMIINRTIILDALVNTQVEFEDWPILRHLIFIGGELVLSSSCAVLYRQHVNSLSSRHNLERLNWLRFQKIIFLKESQKYKISLYTRLMVSLQILSLSNLKFISKVISFHRHLDCKRLLLKLNR